MALRSIPSTLRRLPPAVGAARDAQGHSRAAEPWRNWYSLARWRRLRWAVLVRDLFTCQASSCGLLVADTSKLVADHVRPHRGDPALFWDEGNVRCLCTWCHSSLKQAEERRGV